MVPTWYRSTVPPSVTRAAVIRDPATAAWAGQFGAIQSAAASFGMEVSPVNLRDTSEIERTVMSDRDERENAAA